MPVVRELQLVDLTGSLWTGTPISERRTAGSKLSEGCGPENSLKAAKCPRQSHLPTTLKSSLITHSRIPSAILHSMFTFCGIHSELYKMGAMHHRNISVLHGMVPRYHHCDWALSPDDLVNASSPDLITIFPW